MQMASVLDLPEHILMHNRPHKQWQGFDYWLRKTFHLWNIIDISPWKTNENYDLWKYAMRDTCLNQKCMACIIQQLERVRKRQALDKYRKHSITTKSIAEIKSRRAFKRGSCTVNCNHIKMLDDLGNKIKAERCRIKCEGNHTDSQTHWHTFGSTHNLVHVWSS